MLGHGAHPDPAGQLAQPCAPLQSAGVVVVAYLLNTEAIRRATPASGPSWSRRAAWSPRPTPAGCTRPQPWCDATPTWRRTLREDYGEDYGVDAGVVPNGVDVERFASASAGRALAARYTWQASARRHLEVYAGVTAAKVFST